MTDPRRLAIFGASSGIGIELARRLAQAGQTPVAVTRRGASPARRASGVPYTIVRPGNLRDELGGQQGLRTLQGGPKIFGRVACAEVATVCVAAVDWDGFFGTLAADAR